MSSFKINKIISLKVVKLAEAAGGGGGRCILHSTSIFGAAVTELSQGRLRRGRRRLRGES